MFTAYKVGIVVALTNQVSSVLSAITADLTKTGKAVLDLQKRLNEIKLATLKGLGMMTVGAGGLDIAKHLIKPGADYAHQLSVMNNLGMTQLEIAEATGQAWDVSRKVLTTTATGNLKAITDLRSILVDVNKETGVRGPIDMKMIYSQLPKLMTIQAAMTASSVPEVKAAGKDDRFIYSIAKSLDIIGASVDPERFAKEAEMMAKVFIASQGRVTPEMYQSVFTFARQEKALLTDDFKYERGLPTLILEQQTGGGSGSGGGSKGIGPMLAAFNRMVTQGIVTPAAAAYLKKFDMIERIDSLKNPLATGKHNQIIKVPVIRGHEDAAGDPYKFTMDYAVPAVKKLLGPKASDKQIVTALDQMFRGNQLMADLTTRIFTQHQQMLREKELIDRAKGSDEAYTRSRLKDPYVAYDEALAQFENVKTKLGQELIPIIVPALNLLSESLAHFGQVIEKHPALAKDLVIGFTALSGVLMFSGVVWTLRAAFLGLKLVLDVTAYQKGIAALTGLASAGGAVATNAAGFAAGGIASRGLLGLAGLLTKIAKLAGPLSVFAYLMDPSSTQTPEQEKEASHDNKTPAERFPDLVVPSTTPAGPTREASAIPMFHDRDDDYRNAKGRFETKLKIRSGEGLTEFETRLKREREGLPDLPRQTPSAPWIPSLVTKTARAIYDNFNDSFPNRAEQIRRANEAAQRQRDIESGEVKPPPKSLRDYIHEANEPKAAWNWIKSELHQFKLIKDEAPDILAPLTWEPKLLHKHSWEIPVAPTPQTSNPLFSPRVYASPDARERDQQKLNVQFEPMKEENFFQKLVQAVRQAIVEGISHAEIKMDGRAVNSVLQGLQDRDNRRPPSDSGFNDITQSPLYPAVPF